MFSSLLYLDKLIYMSLLETVSFITETTSICLVEREIISAIAACLYLP